MKKAIAIVMILILVVGTVFTSCTPSKPAKETTEEEIMAEEFISAQKKLLNDILSTEFYLSLADEEYKSVIEFIKNETPDQTTGIKSSWFLDDGYELVLTSSRVLKLVKSKWYKTLCENIDYPNSLPVMTSDWKIVNDCSYHASYKSIEVWKLGEMLFKVELPSSDIEFVAVIKNGETTEVVVRSDSTIGSIIYKDGKYQYDVISKNAAGPIQNMLSSIWFVDKDANLVHLNIQSKQMEIIGNNIISLANPHDGNYTVGWREKGSLEWHEPEYLISEQGEKINWSDYGGM